MILMQERQEAPIEMEAAEGSGLDDTSHRRFEGALAEALLFARRTNKILAETMDELSATDLLRLRLARAHVLGVIDHVEDLLGHPSR